MRPITETFLESTDLFVLKHLWKLASPQNRQRMRDSLSDQLPESNQEPFAKPRRIWSRLSERERQQWLAWVVQQPA